MLFTSRLVATVLLSLLAGSYFNGPLILLPAQRQLSPSAYIEAERANTSLGTIRFRVLIAATLAAQLTLLAASGFQSRRSFYFTAGSILLILAATFITVRFVVPINAAIHTWNPALPPANWQVYRDSWHRYHLQRTVLMILALVAQLAAVLRSAP